MACLDMTIWIWLLWLLQRRRLRTVLRAGGWQQLTLETREEAVRVWASPGLALHCTVSGHALLQEAEAIFEDHIYMIVDIYLSTL